MKTLTALLALLVLTTPLFAQDKKLKRPQLKRERGKLYREEATLMGFARGVLQVKASDGKIWLVAMGSDTKTVSVVGKADASWLRPGMLVKFSARFDRKGEAIAPIEDLSVVTLREGMRLGLTPENLSSGGAGGAAGLGNLFGDDDEQKKTVKKPTRPKKLKPEDIAYTVVGKIAKIKDEEISIAAGRLLKIELADKPRIDVDVADLSLATPGTSMVLDAWYYADLPGRAMLINTTVALPKTLEGPKKKRPVITTKNK